MKYLVVVFLVLASALPAAAMDLDAITGRFGVAIINNTAPTAPNPVINTLGASFNLPFSEDSLFSFDPALDILWTNYEWYDGRAAPTESETGEGNNVFVLGFLLDLPVVVNVRFSDKLGGAFSLGPAFLLRVSFKGDTTEGLEATMDENLRLVSAYFWQSGRWLYPSTAFRFDVFLQEGITFSIGARGFLPLFNAWDPGIAFWDHAMIHVTLGMRIRL
ncbi:MAG: hypothetical protein JW923_08195 [Spirochaetales bacterium]|nr:hypothetical protein [Spirochaetales bacterium]